MNAAWEELLAAWLESLRRRHLSPGTLAAAERWGAMFARLCDIHGAAPAAVEPSHLVALQRRLREEAGPGGRRYAPASIAQALQQVRNFVRWLVERRVLLIDPSAGWVLRRCVSSPGQVLTVAEVTALLQAPDTSVPLGLRDRAVLELLYGTGIRRGECCALDVQDVDLSHQVLCVRRGKGQRDRLLPIGETLGDVLNDWLQRGRPHLVRRDGETALFVSFLGRRLSAPAVVNLVRERAQQAGIEKLTPHALRRTFATHLVERGADVRHVQMLLGHQNVDTTQAYALVELAELRREYERTHPRAARTARKAPTSPFPS